MSQPERGPAQPSEGTCQTIGKSLWVPATEGGVRSCVKQPTGTILKKNFWRK